MKYNKMVNVNFIRRFINSLTTLIRKEFETMKPNENTPWYFDKLSFILEKNTDTEVTTI